ncbi:chitin synthase I [Scheffersomyces spartinae]|uniref:chitin synthase n=1 Tax=Scheffersomyces spartinae TaxID=45513 RepID=A0A9P7VA90_9ASCO|nr:chitin synthase I [Scheffersomyces spartinae]KAG7194075.1 Chitin synthase, class 1 [Scheffersomyces spartinae]
MSNPNHNNTYQPYRPSGGQQQQYEDTAGAPESEYGYYSNAGLQQPQQEGAYLFSGDNSSSHSINFSRPTPAYNQQYQSSGGADDQQTYRPSNIFSAPLPGRLSSNEDPFDSYDNYELNDMSNTGYEGYDNLNQNQNYGQSFVPHAYEDEEEREYDRNIRYNDIQGDYLDLASIQINPPLSLSPFDSQVLRLYPMAEHSAPPLPIQPDQTQPQESPFMDQYEQEPLEEELEPEQPPIEEQIRARPQMGIATGINGHLVLDCPVAPELLAKYPTYNPELKDGGLSREFSYMRYTAVTCGPSNFYNEGYMLRPVHYPVPRQTEIMVVITMYNENDILLARTLKGIKKNMKHLESRTKSSTWGKDSWKKVVVCIVSDGRSKINERAQALMAAFGVYQEGLAKSMVDDRNVQGHIYEYTTRVGINNIDETVKLTTTNVVPIQMLFLLKEKNAKKINSHRWCFQALGRVLDPKIVVLLDAGTEPSEKSLYNLWKEFERDPQVAGACGEIRAMLRKREVLTNPLVYAQNFEYKISNILDKPMESAFGFISVLPGAFSAYRYVALQNDVNGRGPLEKYFKGEFLHGSGEVDPNDDERELKLRQMKDEAGIFTSNMYLAEDRILCYELVAKRGCQWLLRYVKSASAVTDVPGGLAEFILQRRRWLNGSFFAAIYSLAHFPQIWRSSHSFGRKVAFHIEFFYQLISLVVSWFSIGSYFLVFRILSSSLSASSLNFAPGRAFSLIFLWLYLASIVTTFVLSFGNKPKGTEKFYIVIVIFFAILMAYMIFAAIFMAVHSIQEIMKEGPITISLFFKNAAFRDLVVATVSTYALYFIASFLYLEPWHMFTSFLQYILLSPSYVNVLNIYAFCNIDDISWGTKGDTGAKTLGVAKVRDDGTFDVNIPILKEEINQSYENQLAKIKVPPPPEEQLESTNEDYYAFVRSMTVLVWMFSNFVIIAVVLETGGLNRLDSASDLTRTTRSEIFLTVILWTVAFMALFRFVGCVWYLVSRMTIGFKSTPKRQVAPTVIKY